MRPSKEVEIGRRFGKLVVTRKAKTEVYTYKSGKNKGKKARFLRYVCQCDCGKNSNIRGNNLLFQNTRSCGCLQVELASTAKKPIQAVAAKEVFFRYQGRARKKNIPFTLSFDEFQKLIFKACHYCQAEPSGSCIVTRRKVLSDRTVSYNGIDRVENLNGYTPENTVSCCRYCNIAKMDRGLSEFHTWIETLYYRRNEWNRE